jgi:hypothetical protein
MQCIFFMQLQLFFLIQHLNLTFIKCITNFSNILTIFYKNVSLILNFFQLHKLSTLLKIFLAMFLSIPNLAEMQQLVNIILKLYSKNRKQYSFRFNSLQNNLLHENNNHYFIYL